MDPLPQASQPQIIRAHQKDFFHLAHLRDQTQSVLRACFGTRWLTQWDQEVDLLTKLVYFGLTVGRGIQTLGEEYVDIWQYTPLAHLPPSVLRRSSLVLLPPLPSYVYSRFARLLPSNLSSYMRSLFPIFEIAVETNLAIFYLFGTYYDLTRRLTRVQHLSSVPPDPNNRPPSYSLLGVLLSVRLAYQLSQLLSPAMRIGKKPGAQVSKDANVDSTSVVSLLPSSSASAPEQDFTQLTIADLLVEQRAGRKCALCLEERTSSTVTECGHLFCWTCIVGWGQEKSECPLCRQSLPLNQLVPIYNL